MTRAHGTRARYTHDVCRCDPCRAARRAYELDRIKRLRYGIPAYVDATRARDHVRGLMMHNVGWRRVAALAGLPESAVAHLLYGKGGKPRARIRPATEAALLAVTPDAAPPLVDAQPTWDRIHALMALGYSRAWIAGQIGRKARGLQLDRWRVTRRNADAVRALYERVGDTPAPDSPSASRARGEAQRNGWLTPLELEVAGEPLPDGDDVDEVAVERALAGEPVALNRAEHAEVARRCGERRGAA